MNPTVYIIEVWSYRDEDGMRVVDEATYIPVGDVYDDISFTFAGHRFDGNARHIADWAGQHDLGYTKHVIVLDVANREVESWVGYDR